MLHTWVRTKINSSDLLLIFPAANSHSLSFDIQMSSSLSGFRDRDKLTCVYCVLLLPNTTPALLNAWVLTQENISVWAMHRGSLWNKTLQLHLTPDNSLLTSKPWQSFGADKAHCELAAGTTRLTKKPPGHTYLINKKGQIILLWNMILILLTHGVTIGLHGLAWPSLCVGEWGEFYTQGSAFVDLAKQSLIDGVAF